MSLRNPAIPVSVSSLCQASDVTTTTWPHNVDESARQPLPKRKNMRAPGRLHRRGARMFAVIMRARTPNPQTDRLCHLLNARLT